MALDLAWGVLKDFYTHPRDENRFLQGLPTSIGRFAPQWRDAKVPMRAGLSPQLQPDDSFVGVRVGSHLRDDDESIRDISDTLEHEHTHQAIDDEIKNWIIQTYGPLSKQASYWKKLPAEHKDRARSAIAEKMYRYAHEYGAAEDSQLRGDPRLRDIHRHFSRGGGAFPVGPQKQGGN